MDDLDDLKERREYNSALVAQMLPSIDPGSYKIKLRDYKRNNADERYYRQKYLLPLLRCFDCRCAVCGSDEDGLELDHFWVPKAKGGNFLLKLNNVNKLVNNGVPLCQSCNRQKHEEGISVTQEQRGRIHLKARNITALANDDDLDPLPELLGYREGDLERAKAIRSLKPALVYYENNPDEARLNTVKAHIADYLLLPRPKHAKPE